MTDPIQNGFGAQAIDQEAIYRALQGSYISSGCTPSKGANALEVDIASGVANVGGSEVSVSAQTVTLTAGDSDPRKDIIYLDATGTAQVAPGTPAPAQPTGETRRDTFQPQPVDLSGTTGVVVGEVWVPAGASDVTTGDISDRRPLFTFQGTPNVPAWEKDGSTSVTSSSTLTYTLNNTYEHVLVSLTQTDQSGAGWDVGLQVNGDTGANYNYRTIGGTNTTGVDRVGTLINSVANETFHMMFAMSGKWSYQWGLDATQTYTNDGGVAEYARNLNVTSPLTQFTLLKEGGNLMDASVTVYGLSTP